MLGEIDVLDETSLRMEIEATFEPAHRSRGDEGTATVEAERLPSLDDLVFSVVAAFRQHGHISNVLSHISGSNWGKVEQALRSILDPHVGSRDLSPLAQNIIDLMCADRGVTGRIMRPYFRRLLDAILKPEVAARFARHITVLFLELECKARQPMNAVPTVDEVRPTGEPN
jgi:hypothetical protein